MTDMKRFRNIRSAIVDNDHLRLLDLIHTKLLRILHSVHIVGKKRSIYL